MTNGPELVHHESIPFSYDHPYFFTKSKDGRTLFVFSSTDSSFQPVTIHVDDPKITHITPHVFADKYILVCEGNDIDSQSILLYRLEDGALSDSKTIVSDSDPSNPTHLPLPGDSAFLGATRDLFTIFKNGAGSKDSLIEIYGVSDDGKFALKNELKQPGEGPALSVNVEYKVWSPTGYLLPTRLYFNKDVFVGEFGQHAVKLVKWTAEPSDPSTVEFPGSRFIDDIDESQMESWLNDRLYIPSRNSLITAHHEFPRDFMDLASVTSIRSINPDTLDLNWCSPIVHTTKRLSYNNKSNVLIAIGDSGHRDGERLPRSGIYILDASNGAVRKEAFVDAWCQTSPSGDEIVLAYDTGAITVISLHEFIEHGFPDESSSNTEESNTRFSLPAFYPKLEREKPMNSKARTSERKTVERYAKSGSPRPWVKGLFVGDGVAFLKGDERVGFATIRWK